MRLSRGSKTAQFAAVTDEPLDYQWLAGKTAEEGTFKPNGDLIGRNYTDYGWYLTASEYNRRARIRYVKFTENTVRVDDGTANGATRKHRVDYVVDNGGGNYLDIYAGLVRKVHDQGNPATATDDVCTITDWDINSSAWIRVPISSKVYQGTCATVGSGATLLSQVDTVYDGSGTNQTQSTITKGLPTQLSTRVSTTAGVDPIRSRTSYDTYGRVASTWDTQNKETAIAYANATTPGNPNNLVTQVTVTRPLGLASTTLLEARKGLPTAVGDENNKITTLGYNGLGQLTGVNYPDNIGGTSPSIEYIYSNNSGAPSRVKVRTLRNGPSTIDDSYVFYDGWGRPVETQVPQPETPAERIVSVTGYDNQGQVRFSMPAVPNNNVGSGFGTVLNPSPSDVARYTVSDYDAAQRPIAATKKTLNTVVSTTTTAYKGDRIVDHPAFGGDTVTELDWWNRPATIRLHSAGETSTILDRVNHTYDGAGRLVTMTKPLSGTTHIWAYAYDLAGRRTYALDPDTGTTTTAYDDSATTGPTETVTTPSGSIKSAYDAIGRPTTRTDVTSGASNLLASWTYDTATNGKGRLASETTKLDQGGVAKPASIATAGDFVTNITAYDAVGRPTAVNDTYPAWLTGEFNPSTETGAKLVVKPTTYTYNEGGLQTAANYPAEGTVGALSLTSTYKTNGMHAQTTQGTNILATSTYNSIAQVNLLNSGTTTNVEMSRGYTWHTATGWLNEMSAVPRQGTTGSTYFTALTLKHTYDDNGNPLRIVGTSQDTSVSALRTGAWCYTYDQLNRLKTARTGAPNSTTPTCDADNGTDPAAGTGGTGSRGVTGTPYNLTYGYDAAGDRLNTVALGGGLGTYTYAYNTAAKPHQASAITLSGAASTAPGTPTTGSLIYDSQGRVTTLSTTSGPNTGTTYTYDRQGNLENHHPDRRQHHPH